MAVGMKHMEITKSVFLLEPQKIIKQSTERRDIKGPGGRKCRHEQGSKRIVTINDYIRLIESLEQVYLLHNSSGKSKKKGMRHAFIIPTSQMRKQALRHIN